jgi:aspartyl-tRNA(Asn)/glutamyl-tRNA(Gln) amidotransferase subunit A
MSTFIKTYAPTSASPATHVTPPLALPPALPPAFLFSIKDLFDVAGEVTTAGSQVLLDAAPAQADAVAVARLKAAGGVPVGRTNMSEFAFSGVGFNPHYGTPVNPHPLACKPHPERVTGGSSSGAAASVGCKDGEGRHLADIGLGSDTGGSIRIPAALCGLVGFKSTARLVPTVGAFPLSTTLDTVGAITRDVAAAILAHEILAARTVEQSTKPMTAYRIGIVNNVFLDGMDDTVSRAWARTITALSDKGVQMTDIELPELAEIPNLNRTGGFSPIEAYRQHKQLIESRQSEYDPRVAQRILLGKGATQTDYETLQAERAEWITRVLAKLAGFDAILSPTVPIVAPTMASIESDDTEFFRVNALLLRNPSIVNLLDGCAISIPCQLSDELPVGLMIWHGAMHDDVILNLALQIEQKMKHKLAPVKSST